MKILVISLYDGSNEIEEVSSDDKDVVFEGMERSVKGDKNVWLGEEFIYVELSWALWKYLLL